MLAHQFRSLNRTFTGSLDFSNSPPWDANRDPVDSLIADVVNQNISCFPPQVRNRLVLKDGCP